MKTRLPNLANNRTDPLQIHRPAFPTDPLFIVSVERHPPKPSLSATPFYIYSPLTSLIHHHINNQTNSAHFQNSPEKQQTSLDSHIITTNNKHKKK